MKVKNSKVYLFLLILLVWSFIFNLLNMYIDYANVINYVVWIVVLIICFKLFNDEYKRDKYKEIIFKDVLIFVLFYVIIYYLLGFVVGFEKSPLSFSLFNIIRNLLFYVGLKFCMESVKYYLLKENNTKLFVLFITLLFVLFNIDFKYFIGLFYDSILTFEYVCKTIIPLFVFGVLGTFLITNSDLKTNLLVQLVPVVLIYLIPFAPNLDWYFYSIFHIIFALVLYFVVKYEIEKREVTVKEANKSIFTFIPFLVIFIVSILFVLGVFKYVPLSVASNSMKPLFSRGDAIVYKKVKDIDKIVVDDVVCYRSDDKIVMHRVVKIEKINGKKYFTTKGDNLSANDPFKVKEKQILGTIKLVVPKIGFPSVWLYEFLK